MYDTHKGVFLPLEINFQLNSKSHLNNETTLRALHLPINLYKRRMRPAYDDAVKFE